jgi:3-hydroxyisobutyrate dehydrogenase-like beta-hydroxyacid dehydrogenase
MGRPMAAHVLNAGYDLWVHNRSQQAVTELVGKGAKQSDPVEMAGRCDAVLLCLPTSVETAEVTERLLASAQPGLIVCDHSTIQPRVAKRLAQHATRFDATFLDAPITGGEKGAIEGTLSTMVGGDPEALARVEPVLKAFSAKVTHVGESGSGQMTKLANQIVCAVTIAAVAEGLSFAKVHGLDLDKTIDVLSGGAADSWTLRNLGSKMVSHDFRPGFSLRLALKDLRYAIESAADCGAFAPATALIQQLFGSLVAQGRGQEGITAIYDLYCRLSTPEAVSE